MAKKEEDEQEEEEEEGQYSEEAHAPKLPPPKRCAKCEVHGVRR